MLVNKILGFSEQKSFLRMVREEVMPYLSEAIAVMSRSDLLKMKKYVFCFATAKEIREIARNDFYGLIEKIEESLEKLPESVESETSEAEDLAWAEFEDEDVGTKTEPILKPQNEFQVKLMSEISEEEILAEILKKRKEEESSEEESSEESVEVDLTQVNVTLPRTFRNFMDATQASKAEVMAMEEEVDDGAGLDEEYGDMGFDELRAKLSPYFMMSKKKKRTYFQNLTKEFIRKVVPRKSGLRMKKVNFNVKENQVVTFFKDAKIKK